jgi:hypothetical protein
MGHPLWTFAHYRVRVRRGESHPVDDQAAEQETAGRPYRIGVPEFILVV